MLYLELGVIPIRFTIKSRRLNFYKYIIDEPSESLLFKVLDAQVKQPTRNDLGETVKEDFTDINIDIESVKAMTRKQFKMQVKGKIEDTAFKYLIRKKLNIKKSGNFHTIA